MFYGFDRTALMLILISVAFLNGLLLAGGKQDFLAGDKRDFLNGFATCKQD